MLIEFTAKVKAEVVILMALKHFTIAFAVSAELLLVGHTKIPAKVQNPASADSPAIHHHGLQVPVWIAVGFSSYEL
jgi:hypothetical protein